MTRYHISIKCQVDIEAEAVEKAIVDALTSYWAEIESIQVAERNPPGRQKKKDPKLERWLKGRTKPYTLDKFAEYMKLSKSGAHRRLSRLVEERRITKIREGRKVSYMNGPSDALR